MTYAISSSNSDSRRIFHSPGHSLTDSRKAHVSAYFLIAGIGLFPFYLFPSGGIQISHALLAIGALFYSIRFFTNPFSRSEGYFGFLFCTYVFCAGLLWYLFHQDEWAILGPLFMLYNIFIYATLLSAFVRFAAFFRSWLPWAIFAGLLAQFFWYYNGWGTELKVRFHGTFNDPNQLSYWAICALATIAVLEQQRLRWSLIIFLGVSFILLLTTSRSGLLGIFPLSLLIVIRTVKFIWKENTFRTLAIKIFTAFGICIAFGTFYLGIVSTSNVYTWAFGQISALEKRMIDIEVERSLEVRGYELLWLYPEHLILGAGHGGLERFPLAKGGSGADNEIHSTFAGFFFYYGIVGSLLMIAFLYPRFRKLTLTAVLALFGAAFFGIGTYGARNTMAWIMIAAAATYGQRGFQSLYKSRI